MTALCPSNTSCPICGKTLSNKLIVSPGMLVHAWCIACSAYVPLKKKILLVEEENKDAK